MTIQELEARRLKAIPLFNRGMIPAKVAYKCGVSRSTALRWRDRWKAGDSLQSIPKTGRPKLLTEGQRAAALSMFIERGATVQQFQTFILVTFAIDYTPGHARRLMKRWGIPVIKTRAKRVLASSERATAQTEVRG